MRSAYAAMKEKLLMFVVVYINVWRVLFFLVGIERKVATHLKLKVYSQNLSR
jgi:hypothetical protein